ncbi:radical SAM family heme chaperone HemW [soil metagenome]
MYFDAVLTTPKEGIMRNQNEAFANAATVLSQLGIPKMLPVLRTEAGVFMRRTILGGSHSVVTYPPLNALQQFGPHDHIYPIHYGGKTNLYIHIAFCETSCTFCHYVIKNYRGKKHSPQTRVDAVKRYLSALKMEIKDWADELRFSGTSISSIYIGGGTPLILETVQLVELLETITTEFNVIPLADICIEGSPLTIIADEGKEKLETLKQMGVTRLSFGVQSFDSDVLKYSARGYDQWTAIRACEIASEVFENWNLDLIQSLYKGHPDEVWANIVRLRELLPPHITWYHGRFADRPQGKWLRDMDRISNFENENATLLGRMLIWEELADLGYHQVDGNRFVRDTRFIDPFKKSRTSVTSNLLGLGASAYSHVDMRPYPRDINVPDGVFFRNSTSIDDYVARIEAGNSAVTSGLGLDEVENLAASYIVGLRTGRTEPELFDYERPASLEDRLHYQSLVEDLRSWKLLESNWSGNQEILKLSRLGMLFEDEILSLFYSPWVQERLQGQGTVA